MNVLSPTPQHLELHSFRLRVVNDGLLHNYRIAGVSWPPFPQTVPNRVQNESRGLLTGRIAILTMNSDGKDSHPLKTWRLDARTQFLHDPPPPTTSRMSPGSRLDGPRRNF